jgi:anti-sigma factor RsiW
MSGATPRPIEEDDLLALVDGRLDPARRAFVEKWLGSHPVEAARVAVDRDVRRRLREQLASVAEEPIPERLRLTNFIPPRPKPVASRWPIAAAAAICLVIGGAGGWAGHAAMQAKPTLERSGASPATRDAVAAFRTFTTEVLHPVEVKADQEPHLIQWLSKRLGQPVLVPDLGAEGFHLMGGRVLPAGDTLAALLMYDDDQGTRLTLYSRVGAADGRSSFRYAREGDVAAFSWVEGGLSFVVTARIDEARLLRTAGTIDAQLRARTNATP